MVPGSISAPDDVSPPMTTRCLMVDEEATTELSISMAVGSVLGLTAIRPSATCYLAFLRLDIFLTRLLASYSRLVSISGSAASIRTAPSETVVRASICGVRFT